MPRHPRRSARADVALALVLCALAQLEVLVAGAAPAGLVSAVVCTLPLALRRRAPLVATAAICAGAVVDRILGGTLEVPLGLNVAALVAAYAVASYATLRVAALGGLLAMAGVALSWWWSAPADVRSIHALLIPAMTALTWLAGRMARGQRRREHRMSALVADLEAERETGARVVVLEERARMARELHDAIAHAVSQMVVQAAAAETVLASASARSVPPLRAVQHTGREAIMELRRLLGILRSDAAAAPRVVAPPAPPDVPRRRARPRWPWWLDPLLATLCAAVIEVEVATAAHYAEHRWVSALLVLVAILPLAVRRRFPLAVLVTVVVAAAAQQIVVDWEGREAVRLVIGPLVALYTVGAHASRQRAIAGGALTVLVGLAAELAVLGVLSPRAVAGWPVFVAVPLLSGAAVQARRRQAERLHTLALRLKREQAARARLAVMEERARMARDLHDEVAHGVSVMVLQAGAAEQVLATSPEQARAATRAIQDTGRTVLAELQRLLGVLRSDEEESPRSPGAGLAQLDGLIADVRRAGLPVELRVEGTRVALGAGLDVSAYRVVQEGLTNALKHAGPVATAVTVRFQPGTLTLEVLNAPGGGRGGSRASGHGLLGMRERVALYGGELEAGPRPSGGYAVRARLPLGGPGA